MGHRQKTGPLAVSGLAALFVVLSVSMVLQHEESLAIAVRDTAFVVAFAALAPHLTAAQSWSHLVSVLMLVIALAGAMYKWVLYPWSGIAMIALVVSWITYGAFSHRTMATLSSGLVPCVQHLRWYGYSRFFVGKTGRCVFSVMSPVQVAENPEVLPIQKSRKFLFVGARVVEKVEVTLYSHNIILSKQIARMIRREAVEKAGVISRTIYNQRDSKHPSSSNEVTP